MSIYVTTIDVGVRVSMPLLTHPVERDVGPIDRLYRIFHKFLFNNNANTYILGAFKGVLGTTERKIRLKGVVKQMFSDKYRQHWGFSGWQLLTLFFVPLFPKPLNLNLYAHYALLGAPDEVKTEVASKLENNEAVTAAEIRRLKLANDSLKLTSTCRETRYANNATYTNRSHASRVALLNR